jgi:hypothetical protein
MNASVIMLCPAKPVSDSTSIAHHIQRLPHKTINSVAIFIKIYQKKMPFTKINIHKFEILGNLSDSGDLLIAPCGIPSILITAHTNAWR